MVDELSMPFPSAYLTKTWPQDVLTYGLRGLKGLNVSGDRHPLFFPKLLSESETWPHVLFLVAQGLKGLNANNGDNLALVTFKPLSKSESHLLPVHVFEVLNGWIGVSTFKLASVLARLNLPGIEEGFEGASGKTDSTSAETSGKESSTTNALSSSHGGVATVILLTYFPSLGNLISKHFVRNLRHSGHTGCHLSRKDLEELCLYVAAINRRGLQFKLVDFRVDHVALRVHGKELFRVPSLTRIRLPALFYQTHKVLGGTVREQRSLPRFNVLAGSLSLKVVILKRHFPCQQLEAYHPKAVDIGFLREPAEVLQYVGVGEREQGGNLDLVGLSLTLKVAQCEAMSEPLDLLKIPPAAQSTSGLVILGPNQHRNWADLRPIKKLLEQRIRDTLLALGCRPLPLTLILHRFNEPPPVLRPRVFQLLANLARDQILFPEPPLEQLRVVPFHVVLPSQHDLLLDLLVRIQT
ncbi:hypothetical protein CR513_39264, partial [Mucuna pruriens]